MFKLSRTEAVFYTYHVLRGGIILLMFIVFASANQFWLYIGHPSLGFGCSVQYNEKADCLHNLSPQRPPIPPLEIFIELHQANMAGAGCDHRVSDIGTLSIQTASLELSLKRNSDILEVNGQALKKGETFQVIDIRDASPWVISRIEMKNLGVILTCERREGKSMEIKGSYGTEFSLAKGMTILLVLFAGWLGINFRLGTLKQ